MTEFELEKIAMEKLNKLLHEHKVGFQFKRPPIDKWPWSMVEIDGRCLGRVYWDCLLHVVNAFSRHSTPEKDRTHLYFLFAGLESKSLEELLVKLDVVHPIATSSS